MIDSLFPTLCGSFSGPMCDTMTTGWVVASGKRAISSKCISISTNAEFVFQIAHRKVEERKDLSSKFMARLTKHELVFALPTEVTGKSWENVTLSSAIIAVTTLYVCSIAERYNFSFDARLLTFSFCSCVVICSVFSFRNRWITARRMCSGNRVIGLASRIIAGSVLNHPISDAREPFVGYCPNPQSSVGGNWQSISGRLSPVLPAAEFTR